ncbi:response regulator [bacterium]|nr:response regulator [bacterium]
MDRYSLNPLDTDGFVPRWDCGIWSPELGWLHILSDLATWGAYTAIPIALVYFISRRRDIPFSGLFWLFGAFILACGTTHLLEAIIFWSPIYRLSGLVKLATAIVSWVTFFALVRVLPAALALPELARKGETLEAELKERKRAELFVRGVLNSIQSAVAVFNKGGILLAANKAWQQWWPSEEGSKPALNVPKQTPAIADSPLHQAQIVEGIDAVLHGHEEQKVTDVKLKANAETATFLVSITPLAMEDAGVVVSCTDITAIKELQKEIVEAKESAVKANQAKTMFLAGMSHELRTPLAAILGLAEELHDRSTDKENRAIFETIRTQGFHLLQLVNDVLDLSKVETGKMSIDPVVISPSQLVREVLTTLRMAAWEKGLSLDLSHVGGLPRRIKVDPLRLKQVLINLLSNAIKFTDTGTVSLNLSTENDLDGYWLIFRIKDTGPGIAPEDQQFIFEPFAQAKRGTARHAGGVGLGLTLCRHMIEKLGGTISLDSRIGKGTTFRVRLPITEKEYHDVEQPDSTVPEPASTSVTTVHPMLARKGRVLVAEDMPAIQFMLEIMLNEVVDELIIAKDGEEVVEEALRAEKDGRPYDLILMDMLMPKLNGYEATTTLRSHGFNKPIIALTASAMKGDREECLAAGCNDYIPKPIDRATLHQALAKYIT